MLAAPGRPLLACTPRPADGPRLELDSEVAWQRAWTSASAASPASRSLDGGASFLAISDRGTWARGDASSATDGRLDARRT